MKKILVSFIVLVAFTTTTFASSQSDYDVFSKLNNKSTFSGLVGYIDADQQQVDFLQHVFEVTEVELKAASKTDNEKATENVLNYNYRNVKNILTADQYKKYLVYLNVYLKNDVLLTQITK